ncbi:MJ0042 family finger-like protein [Chitinispirillum alkaliphilum]|nr:MJ0042 family finger-like protein [Chitinispirillum alkaliphilum]
MVTACAVVSFGEVQNSEMDSAKREAEIENTSEKTIPSETEQENEELTASLYTEADAQEKEPDSEIVDTYTEADAQEEEPNSELVDTYTEADAQEEEPDSEIVDTYTEADAQEEEPDSELVDTYTEADAQEEEPDSELVDTYTEADVQEEEPDSEIVDTYTEADAQEKEPDSEIVDTYTEADVQEKEPDSELVDTYTEADAQVGDEEYVSGQEVEAAQKGTLTGQDSHINPFAAQQGSETETDVSVFQTGYQPSGDDEEAEDEQTEEVFNPFITGAAQPQVSLIEDDHWSFDLLLDISAGASFAQIYDLVPDHIGSKSRGDAQFSVGLKVPFREYLFTRLSVKYMRFHYLTEFSSPDIINMEVTTQSEEMLSYFAVPFDLGLKIPLGRVVSTYIYGSAEPVYLLSAGQKRIRETFVSFDDGAYLNQKTIENRDITNYRRRTQVFLGGSAGIQFEFGYGFMYFDAGVRYAYFTTENRYSRPMRTESKIRYFPVTSGIRFYL